MHSTLTERKSLLSRAGVGNLTLDMIAAAGVTEYATIAQIYQHDLMPTTGNRGKMLTTARLKG